MPRGNPRGYKSKPKRVQRPGGLQSGAPTVSKGTAFKAVNSARTVRVPRVADSAPDPSPELGVEKTGFDVVRRLLND